MQMMKMGYNFYINKDAQILCNKNKFAREVQITDVKMVVRKSCDRSVTVNRLYCFVDVGSVSSPFVSEMPLS